MTDLSLPPSGRTTRIPRAALCYYGAGANPGPAMLLNRLGECSKRRGVPSSIRQGYAQSSAFRPATRINCGLHRISADTNSVRLACTPSRLYHCLAFARCVVEIVMAPPGRIGGWFEGKGVSTSRVSPPGPLSISYGHVGCLKGRFHLPCEPTRALSRCPIQPCATYVITVSCCGPFTFFPAVAGAGGPRRASRSAASCASTELAPVRTPPCSHVIHMSYVQNQACSHVIHMSYVQNQGGPDPYTPGGAWNGGHGSCIFNSASSSYRATKPYMRVYRRMNGFTNLVSQWAKVKWVLRLAHHWRWSQRRSS
jgi:hypothetical protein